MLVYVVAILGIPFMLGLKKGRLIKRILSEVSMFTVMNLLLALKIILKLSTLTPPPIYLSVCGLRNTKPLYMLHVSIPTNHSSNSFRARCMSCWWDILQIVQIVQITSHRRQVCIKFWLCWWVLGRKCKLSDKFYDILKLWLQLGRYLVLESTIYSIANTNDHFIS